MFDSDFWSLVNEENKKNNVQNNMQSDVLELRDKPFDEIMLRDINNFDEIKKIILHTNNIARVNDDILRFTNLLYLEISNNNIKLMNCNVLPASLEEFIFTNNKTIGIAGFKAGIKKIDLSRNKLKSIFCEFPETLGELNLSKNNFMQSLPNLSKCCNLEILDISNTCISNIDKLPNSIREIITFSTKIQKINKFPENLEIFIAYKCNISEINTEFPPKIREFDVYNNKLNKTPDFPNSIETIDLSNNDLMKLPYIPESIRDLDLKNNPNLNIEEIKELEKKYNCAKILYSTEKYITNNNSTKNSNLGLNYNNFIQRKIFNPNFSETNPHFIIHKCTYSI